MVCIFNKRRIGYDRISWIYDPLSKLVFGKSIYKAQIEFFDTINANSKICIVGGGTGRVLTALNKLGNKNLQITYLDKSSKMLAIAARVKCPNLKVKFIQIDIQYFLSNKIYDVLMTNFLFSNFTNKDAILKFNSCHQLLVEGGYWYFCDFTLTVKKGLFWKKFLLKLMYSFFYYLKIIENKQLVEMKEFFAEKSYVKMHEKHFFGTFIVSTLYKKRNFNFNLKFE